MNNKFYARIRFLALIGILLALYLLWQYFFRPDFKPCNINSLINCDALTSGPISRTLGIPTALIGLAGYLAILIFVFSKKIKFILGMASFGLVFCLWIAYQELFLLRVICPVCIACQLVMITIFVLTLFKLKEKK